VQTIVTHPERYRYLRGEIDLLRSWTMAGAVLQITAGSLLGDFGGQAFEQAWQLVREGHVELVATDSHDARQRPPRLTEALDRLTKEIGSTAAAAMAVENPLKVFEGVPIGHAWSLSND
jgi:protein-tyrosine phosphatase